MIESPSNYPWYINDDHFYLDCKLLKGEKLDEFERKRYNIYYSTGSLKHIFLLWKEYNRKEHNGEELSSLELFELGKYEEWLSDFEVELVLKKINWELSVEEEVKENQWEINNIIEFNKKQP